MKSPLPVPEFCDENISLTFKQPYSKSRPHRPPKPPKLFPKFDSSFNRSINGGFGNGSSSAHAISFRSDRAELSGMYIPSKRESYYEQCFEQISKVGEGSFGEVFKVKSKMDGFLYAVKKSKEFFRGENYRQERLEEVRRYEQFSEHENCVKLYQAWEEDDRLYMQMELCKGSLEDYAREQQFITEAKIWSILLDLLLGLKSLHDRNLIHLDIKLDNILITDDDVCKLADFGLVFDLSKQGLNHASEGDSRYIAPELMEGRYTKAADIFSLGIATLELACNLELPSNGPLWQQLRSGSSLPAPLQSLLLHFSPELQDVIRWMMSPVADARPSVDTLLRFPRIAALHRQRRRWRLVRGIRAYALRKWCNLKLFAASLILSIASCLRLNHAKPSLGPVGNAKNIHKSPAANRSLLNGFNNSNVRTCLMKDFGGESDDDELGHRNGSELDLTGGSKNSDVQITPTLGNPVPTHTPPQLRMMNSTPLNHNHIGVRLSFRHNHIDTPCRNVSYESGTDDSIASCSELVANGGGISGCASNFKVLDEPSGHAVSLFGRASLHHGSSSNDSSMLTKKKLFFRTDDSD